MNIPDTANQDIDNSAPAVIMEGDGPSQENSPGPYAQDFFMGIDQWESSWKYEHLKSHFERKKTFCDMWPITNQWNSPK